jgi:hypothetical protein
MPAPIRSRFLWRHRSFGPGLSALGTRRLTGPTDLSLLAILLGVRSATRGSMHDGRRPTPTPRSDSIAPVVTDDEAEGVRQEVAEGWRGSLLLTCALVGIVIPESARLRGC